MIKIPLINCATKITNILLNQPVRTGESGWHGVATATSKKILTLIIISSVQ